MPTPLKKDSPQPRKRMDVHEESHTELAHDESNWLVSYADMMTLLFGFFVLMYAFSRVDTEKFTVVRKELATYFGGQIKDDPAIVKLKESVENISKDLEIPKDSIKVSTTDQGITLQLNSELLFNSSSAELNQKSKPTLTKIINLIKAQKNIISVSVEGHTDMVPISSFVFPTNWELSAARATRVIRQFEASGFPAEILKAEGYGSSRPLVENVDKQGKYISKNLKLNRRVLVNVGFGRQAEDAIKALKSNKFKRPGFEDKASEKILEDSAAHLAKNLTPEQMRERLDKAKHRIREANKKMKVIKQKEKEQKAQEQMKKRLLDLEKKAFDLERKVKTKNSL